MDDETILAIVFFLLFLGLIGSALMRGSAKKKPAGPHTKAIIRPGKKCPLCGATKQQAKRRTRKRI